jgi:hypothetical protein
LSPQEQQGDLAEPPLRGGPRALMAILRRFAPRQAEAAERESREWFFVCGKCGTARSYRQLGGIRYKAASKGKRAYMACPSCGVRQWHSVERRGGSAAQRSRSK